VSGVEGTRNRFEFLHGVDHRTLDAHLLEHRLRGIECVGQHAVAEDDDGAARPHQVDRLGDHAGHADAFEDHVGCATERGLNLLLERFGRDDEGVSTQLQRKGFTALRTRGDGDAAGAEALGPVRRTDADRARALYQHARTGLQLRQRNAVQAHRQRLDERTVLQRETLRQPDRGVRLGDGVLAQTT
jgi:hypothetical protein